MGDGPPAPTTSQPYHATYARRRCALPTPIGPVSGRPPERPHTSTIHGSALGVRPLITPRAPVSPDLSNRPGGTLTRRAEIYPPAHVQPGDFLSSKDDWHLRKGLECERACSRCEVRAFPDRQELEDEADGRCPA
ncbi:hypothetical protein GCM10027203_72190 [Nonomuraea fastidiosa]